MIISFQFKEEFDKWIDEIKLTPSCNTIISAEQNLQNKFIKTTDVKKRAAADKYLPLSYIAKVSGTMPRCE